MQDYIPRKMDINGNIEPIVVKQYDNLSRYIHLQLFDEDASEDFSEDGDLIPMNLVGCEARLYVELNDGPPIYTDGEVADGEEGIATFLLPGGVTQTPGKYNAEIWIYGGGETQSIISTKPFVLIVEKSIRNDSAIIASESFSALDEIVVRAETAINNLDDVSDTIIEIQRRLMDDEFVFNGGVYGVCNDAQRLLNTEIIQMLFNKYNAIAFKSIKTIETLNLSISVSDYTILKNIKFNCYYTEIVPYTIGANSRANFVVIENVTITTNQKQQCEYGVYFGAYDNSIYVPFTSIKELTISGYKYSLIWGGWNCNSGRIYTYNCRFGAIFLGTSMNIGAVYANACDYGVMLGVFPDDNGVFQGSCFLHYSNIDIISVDNNSETSSVGCLLIGDVRTVGVNVLATEAKHNYTFKNYMPVGTSLTIQNFYVNRAPIVSLMDNTARADNIVICNIFGGYIVDSGKLPVRILNPSIYTRKFDCAYNLFGTVPSDIEKKSSYCFTQPAINIGGSANNTLNLYLNHMNVYGALTNDEELVILLRGARTVPETKTIQNREILFLGKFSIGNADQYNTKKCFGETLISVCEDSASDNTERLQINNNIENLNIGLEMIDDLPAIIINTNTSSATIPCFNYVYMLECIGGAYTIVYKRTREETTS